MNAPAIWILVPGAFAFVTFILRRWERVVWLIGISIASVLGLLALRLPIGKLISLGPWPVLPLIQISESLDIYGRTINIDNSNRLALAFIFFSLAIWIACSRQADTSRLFVPLSLAITSLLICALSIEPFLYGSLLIEVAVLSAIPLLSPPGKPVGRGILRFLIYQTLAMLFILILGWQLSGIESNPENTDFLARIVIIAGLGFALLMAVIPFHTWIPLLLEESLTFNAGFAISIFSSATMVFVFSFFLRYPWILTDSSFSRALIIISVSMIVYGGIWSAFQRNFGRILGLGLVVDIGFCVLLIYHGIILSQANQGEGVLIRQVPGIYLIYFFVIRSIILLVWSISLSIIRKKTNDLSYRSVKGIAFTNPIAIVGITFSLLALIGFPLFPSFRYRLESWEAVSTSIPGLSFLIFLGLTGFLLSGMRSLAVALFSINEINWDIHESNWSRLIIISGIILLVLSGLFPGIFSGIISWLYTPS
jgi:formate hydrogenlyase subunit 3/multisubunit Na+/H+ antiporter MnhD subunit